MIWRVTFFVVLLACYAPLFSYQENLFQETRLDLKPVLPAGVQKVMFGYLRQVAAEFEFVRTAVFLGGLPRGTKPEKYATVLTRNYKEITSLYPDFIDPYYFAQSYLAYVGPKYAESVTEILQTGIEAHPKDIVLRFFQGFDYLYYLDEPLEAARVFKNAAELPDAPPLFLRISALLSAEGGNIYAGLLSLKMMRSTEKDEELRERYDSEIVEFEKAVFIQNALKAFKNKYGEYPETLQELVPEFLQTLPTIQNNFKLIYEKPLLRLEVE